MLREGTEAPDFEGMLDDGQIFHLGSLRGQKNVVLYFYTKDFTPGCTREACAFQENWGNIAAFDAIVVGVSADSALSHTSFRERYNLGFPLIADPDKRLIKAYDARGLLGIMTARVTYVIDKAGIIRSVIRHDLAVERHVPEVIKALEQIQ